MVRRVRIKDHWGEQRIFTIRSIVAAVCVSVLLLAVASRLFYLQVLRHDYYAELSQGNRVRMSTPVNSKRCTAKRAISSSLSCSLIGTLS